MTVAAESDFQSRHVILRNNLASIFRQLSVRGRHLNREHRRANVYIPKTFGIQKPLAESWTKSTGFLPNPQQAALNLKELLAQFRAEVAPQSLANFRVCRVHFLICECATSVSICQSVCERLSCRADFTAAKQIE
jgi:hypothetical protein